MKYQPHSSFLARLWAKAARVLRVRQALPCVGLVVMGGCLTLVITPDEPADQRNGMTAFGNGTLPTIILDAGHGGNDEGTKWRGLAEKHLTLDLAFRTQRLLRTAGFPTKMTRQSDVRVELDERVRIANAEDDALFVSLHFNSHADPGSAGIETFFAKQKVVPTPSWSWIGIFTKPELPPLDNGETLAGAVQAALANRTEARNRGIQARDYFVVRYTRCPAVLIEGGFVSNVFEAQLLGNEEYRDRLAQGIAEGIVAYQRSRPGSVAPASQPLAQAGR